MRKDRKSRKRSGGKDANGHGKGIVACFSGGSGDAGDPAYAVMTETRGLSRQFGAAGFVGVGLDVPEARRRNDSIWCMGHAAGFVFVFVDNDPTPASRLDQAFMFIMQCAEPSKRIAMLLVGSLVPEDQLDTMMRQQVIESARRAADAGLCQPIPDDRWPRVLFTASLERAVRWVLREAE
ncbi:hypothetical protein HY634_00600 [Candidatus Uhrbacteria bacterium]|nr:hypothetical protein [Candidatus Uhrbacteria bacterium]